MGNRGCSKSCPPPHPLQPRIRCMGVGTAPRGVLVALGRVERPRSTAADQGGQPYLPKLSPRHPKHCLSPCPRAHVHPIAFCASSLLHLCTRLCRICTFALCVCLPGQPAHLVNQSTSPPPSRHPRLPSATRSDCLSPYSILHTRYSRIVWSTGPLSLRASRFLPTPPGDSGSAHRITPPNPLHAVVIFF